MVVSKLSSAKNRLVWSVLLIGTLLLASGAAPPSGASHAPTLDESLPYDFSLPIPEEPECDEEGSFLVLFCETLEDDYNRVTIIVRDFGNPTPIPIGAKYEFRNDDGFLLREDVFCGQVNTWVPESAAELLVDVSNAESYVDERHTLGVCGFAPLQGDVWLRWTHGVSPEPEVPADEDPTKKCKCECECDPVFGCECDCTAVDGDHECNECEHDE